MNDTLGHHHGDLLQVCQQLTTTVRVAKSLEVPPAAAAPLRGQPAPWSPSAEAA